ncbi:hypothetical protein TSMEX_003492 [Taenia solium]|eukprot:TsM_001225700 transcript=TsM_001225700 gene=TsM_001225700
MLNVQDATGWHRFMLCSLGSRASRSYEARLPHGIKCLEPQHVLCVSPSIQKPGFVPPIFLFGHIIVTEEDSEIRICCTECYSELMALQEHMRSWVLLAVLITLRWLTRETY